MGITAILNTLYKKIHSKAEKVRLVWQFDREHLKLALFTISDGKMTKYGGSQTLKSRLVYNNQAISSLLKKIFNEVQFLEDDNILMLIKYKTGYGN